MFVDSLALENFRNIKNASLSFGEGCNVLTGSNGQGKTNTVEAIYLALSGKSHRESVTANFIGPVSNRTTVACTVTDSLNVTTLAAVSMDETGKRHFIGGDAVKSRRELLSAYSVVFFTPEDLRIIQDSPAARRTFMNDAISSLYPRYAALVSDYSTVLRQRGFLLKDYGPSANSMMEVYDEQLVGIGSAIITARLKFLKQLSEAAKAKYGEISEKAEDIAFSYLTDIDVTSGELQESYRRALEESRTADISSASTRVGPHHDDMDITVSGRSARRFASRGQQRSVALAMKLALCDMTRSLRGEEPVVLLDDVMSELDVSRRSQAVKLFSGRQVFITTTEVCFDIPSDTRLFKAVSGEISPI